MKTDHQLKAWKKKTVRSESQCILATSNLQMRSERRRAIGMRHWFFTLPWHLTTPRWDMSRRDRWFDSCVVVACQDTQKALKVLDALQVTVLGLGVGSVKAHLKLIVHLEAQMHAVRGLE